MLSGHYTTLCRYLQHLCVLSTHSGLIPRLLGDVLSLWICNMLAHFINTYAIDDLVRKHTQTRVQTTKHNDPKFVQNCILCMWDTFNLSTFNLSVFTGSSLHTVLLEQQFYICVSCSCMLCTELIVLLYLSQTTHTGEIKNCSQAVTGVSHFLQKTLNNKLSQALTTSIYFLFKITNVFIHFY